MNEMDSIDPASRLDSLKFLESGEFSDFVIRCRHYAWNVHKVTISAGCEYFHKVCRGGSDFKENAEDSVDLSEDEPALVARLLLFLYTSSYHVRGVAEIEKRYMSGLAFLLGRDPDDDKDDIHKYPFSVDAACYGLAEKYIVPGLKRMSRKSFQANVQASPRWSQLAKEDYVASIKIIYNTTQPSDGLRDFVVWQAQCLQFTHPTFTPYQDLVRSELEFAWDLVSKGRAKSWVWCKTCRKIVTVSEDDCKCGMMGFCRTSYQCGSWSALKCRNCFVVGRCQSDQPDAVIGKER